MDCYSNYLPFYDPGSGQVCDFTITTDPASSDGIRPSGTTGTTQATVTIQTTPACPNLPVSLSATAVAGSGGHVNHTGVRPVGSFSSAQGNTNANGTFTTTYTAPIFGGTMTISGTSRSVSKQATMQIYVQSLFELGAGTNYTLVGATATHPDNHFGTLTANNNLPLIANDYKAQFYPTAPIPDAEKLRYNDMSLINGGKFEISGNWSATASHQEHRVGINIDLGSSNVPVARWNALTQIFVNRGSPNYLDETASANHWHLRFQ
jgi:hypothetical protein